MKKRKINVNGADHINRSRLIFKTMQCIKGMKAKEVEEITRRNGAKGVCAQTVRKMYKKPSEGGTMWPSSRTLEAIVYATGYKMEIVPRKHNADE